MREATYGEIGIQLKSIRERLNWTLNTLFGTVRQNLRRKEEEYAKIDITPEQKDDAAFKIFDYCMTEFPALKRKFVDMMFDSGVRVVNAQEKVKAAEKVLELCEDDD